MIMKLENAGPRDIGGGREILGRSVVGFVGIAKTVGSLLGFHDELFKRIRGGFDVRQMR